MGKKSRKVRAAAADTEGGLTKQQKKEVMDLVNQVLDKCGKPPSGGGREWEDHLVLYQLIERIRKVQSGHTLPPSNREEHFKDFMVWLEENGVNTQSVAIENFADCGYGLKATRTIPVSEMLLSIPKKVMISTQSARNSPLGALVSQDRILQAMPNVVLALHLLCERYTPGSFWAPYIQILPDTYSLPLYFSPEEILLLKGSPVLSDAVGQYRNIARQYAYFYKQFQTVQEANRIPLKATFYYDDYRWAVSAVMTRQNLAPAHDGSGKVTNVLIPLWDMCNHTNGRISTDYNIEKDCSECFALKDFTEGEQTGADLAPRILSLGAIKFLCGHHDGISKNDPLFAMKAEVLARLGLLPSRVFSLYCLDTPIDGPELLAYLRVFVMEQDDLRARLTGEKARELIPLLGDKEVYVSQANEIKVWSFLHTRASLLLRAYPTTLQEDEELLKKGDLTEHVTMIVQLRVCEKRILSNTVAYAEQQKVKAEAWVEGTEVNECISQPEHPANKGEENEVEKPSVQEGCTQELKSDGNQNKIEANKMASEEQPGKVAESLTEKLDSVKIDSQASTAEGGTKLGI